MASYIESLGAFAPDNLIAGNDIPVKTGSGTIKSGSGKLERGTVLALSSGTAGTGKLLPLGTAAGSDETLTAYAILTDAVDATSGDQVAEVYLTGQFNKNALKVASSYTITTADLVALRNGGIFVEIAV